MQRRSILTGVVFLGLLGVATPALASPDEVGPPTDFIPADEVAAADPQVAVPRSPVDYGRDYGRILILLSVPAAFVGLQLHLARRLHIVPPSP